MVSTCHEVVAHKIMEIAETARNLGYVCENILPKEFCDYMMGETYTCDKVTLNDVFRNDFLILHEVIEISELKKRGMHIDGVTLMSCDKAVIYEAHLTATEYEIKYALNKGDLAWIRLRLSHAREWLRDENLPENLVGRLKLIVNWLLEFAASADSV